MIDFFLPITLFTLKDISYASWSAYALDCPLLFPIHCVKRYRVFAKLWDMLVASFRQYTYIFDNSQVKMFIFRIKNSLGHCKNRKRMLWNIKDNSHSFILGSATDLMETNTIWRGQGTPCINVLGHSIYCDK